MTRTILPTLRRLQPSLLAVAIGGVANAQFFYFEITEIAANPVAGQPTAIELTTWLSSADLTEHYLVVNSVTVALPPVTIPEDTPFVVYLGAAGTNTATEFYLPSAPALTPAGSVALFQSALTAPAEMLSYVDWGGYRGPLINQAVTAGKWTGANASAPLPQSPGSTLANRWISRSAFNLIGPDAWYDDSTPTLGRLNDPGWTHWYGIGCPGLSGPGFGSNPVGPSAWDTGPWLGEPYELGVSPVPTVAVLALGLTATTPLPLDPFGMPGCFGHLSIDATALLDSSGLYGFTPPVNPLLVGFELHMQAFVPSASAPNAAQALVTLALRATIGSR